MPYVMHKKHEAYFASSQGFAASEVRFRVEIRREIYNDGLIIAML